MRKKVRKAKDRVYDGNRTGIMSNKKKPTIFELLDMIEHADNLESLQEEAKRIRMQLEVDSIINELARSNKSYDELMAFLKGEYDE